MIVLSAVQLKDDTVVSQLIRLQISSNTMVQPLIRNNMPHGFARVLHSTAWILGFRIHTSMLPPSMTAFPPLLNGL
jgi:hypothetical protein